MRNILKRVEVDVYTYDELKAKGKSITCDEPFELPWGKVVRIERVYSSDGALMRRTVEIIPDQWSQLP